MQCTTTIGPDNATRAVLPFVAAKGAMEHGTPTEFFLMQEATYLGSERHANLDELQSPGLPSVATVLDALLENDALEEVIVCEPCATARNVTADDLHEWATFGDAADLYAQLERNDNTVTL